jgi:protocatechuate 3,4-dioxygenase alpha subunit
MRGATPSQTIGPFFHVAMASPVPVRLPPADVNAVPLDGRVLDGAGQVIDDALVEVWDGHDRRFARCHTDKDGSFSFLVRDPTSQGDYLAVTVHARGLLGHLVTRCYLGGIGDKADADAALAAVPEDRRNTLVAQRSQDGYRFDIRLQGDDETVFFAF